jgi:glycosyltransferase involved in cell wall biosynthesis
LNRFTGKVAKSLKYRAIKTTRILRALFTADFSYLDKNYPENFIRGMNIVFRLINIILKIRIKIYQIRAVLYVGHLYYYPWYLSRGLRSFGWRADVLNWDANPASQIYYHGEDYKFEYESEDYLYKQLRFYIASLFKYDIFHFSNAHAIVFGFALHHWFKERFGEFFEIYLLKQCGKKIVYSNNACLDGVSQTSFSKWGPESVCSICIWNNVPTVCSDERNLKWGNFRNSVADYQCTLGGNQIDCNAMATVHEVPEFYCLDSDFWSPFLEIPEEFRLQKISKNALRLYHGVGNKESRTNKSGVNIHTSHIYFPLVEKLNREGMELEILSPSGVPNKEVRFIQAQCDIFLDMLTYGWFGAMAREAMMLGKPVICYLRPEWLETMRLEIPEYVEELPIISATPENIEEVLRNLIANPEMLHEIGIRSRKFAIRWHSKESGGNRLNEVYQKLLNGDAQLRESILIGANQ